MSELKATVLVDNIEKNCFEGEWGLSFLIEYRGRNILLDTGGSSAFARNALRLGIDLGDVDYAVLSHAHYDHSDGFPYFFNLNKKAKLYLRSGIKENCRSRRGIFSKYIGIKRGMLKTFENRLNFVSGDYEIIPGVYLIGHKTANLSETGRRAGMFRREGLKRIDDDFSHEQSLVFDTEKGLVIFNSCSHGGAAVIINEIEKTFPEKNIYAMIGGFHLFRSSDEDVKNLAEKLKNTRTEKIVTGHCTGDKAFTILKDALGDKARQMYSGYVFEV